jgi:hypothetical protein
MVINAPFGFIKKTGALGVSAAGWGGRLAAAHVENPLKKWE